MRKKKNAENVRVTEEGSQDISKGVTSEDILHRRIKPFLMHYIKSSSFYLTFLKRNSHNLLQPLFSYVFLSFCFFLYTSFLFLRFRLS